MNCSLFNSRERVEINSRIVCKLSEIYKTPVTCDGGIFILGNGASLSQKVLEQVLFDVIADFNRADVKAETARRILSVVDLPTQTNLLTWLIFQQCSKSDAGKSDVEMVVSILAWIRATRATGRLLTQQSNYRDDKWWPPLPDGAADFLKDF